MGGGPEEDDLAQHPEQLEMLQEQLLAAEQSESWLGEGVCVWSRGGKVQPFAAGDLLC